MIVQAQAVYIAATAAHEANRAYCVQTGDPSQPPFATAPTWQQQSAMNGVWAILENPDITPEQSHEGWMEEKVRNGWIYGPEKDPEKKQHPCLLPYNQLPEDQKVKDELFGNVVRGVLCALGHLDQL